MTGRATTVLLLLAVVAVSVVTAVGAALSGAQPHLIGLPLAAAAVALAGAVAVRAVQRGRVRVELDVPTGDVDQQAARVVQAPVTRRTVIAGAGAAGVAVGALAWAGPEETGGTGWAAGVHVVTPDGRPIVARDVPVGGFATVWPEGRIGDELSAVALVRLETGPAQRPAVLDWVVQERLVAYSKICTHAGCAVGLYRTGSDELYCPCHQAMFDARRGAVPVFGPAAVALPQLPLDVDAQGLLIATGDFVHPVGPHRA